MIRVSRLIASMHVNLATEEEVAAWALKEIARHREASTADLRTENERLRDLLDRAAKSLERNLYRQTEKLEWIAPAFRTALSAQPSEQEGGA